MQMGIAEPVQAKASDDISIRTRRPGQLADSLPTAGAWRTYLFVTIPQVTIRATSSVET